ncbi:MAG: FtsX-like permease family protein [Gammaproteobacteria bacterium]|nr:FtsX-like permease family protein [Gammaproteobacteria bacterium]
MNGLSPLLLRAGFNYQLRHRWQAFLALVGITMGVAVVLAVDLANGAAKASFALSSAQLTGAATHRIIGNDGQVPAALYTRLFTSEDHPPMAPVITQTVKIEGYPGRYQLLGFDVFAEGAFRADLPSAIQGETSLGDWLARPDALAISQSAATALGLKLDDSLQISLQGQSHDLQVLVISDNDSVGSRDLLIADIATAQAISGMREQLSYIDLILDDDDLAWFNGRLPASVKLVDVQEQAEGVVGLSAAFELNLTAMSLLALLVGVFLIFNAMSFSIVQRRNLLGRLRALGVTRQEIYRLILAEALILAIIGSIIGCILGIWLGQGLTAIVAATISELYYQVSSDAMQIGPFTLFKAVALGIGGTLVASWLPAHQAARTPPLTTLSRAALEQSRVRQIPVLLGGGLILVLAGLATTFVLQGGIVSGFAGLFVLIMGAALITPVALPLAHRLLDRLPLGGVWRMATRDMQRHLSRLGTAAAALMVALAATVGVAIMVESMRSSVSDWLQDLLNADLYIAASGFQDGVSLPPGMIDEARQLPTVSALSLYRNIKLPIDGQRTSLIAAQLAAPSRQGFDLLQQQTDDAWSGYEDGGIMISEPLANRTGLAPGDSLRLPTPAGDVDFIVAAIFRDYASEHGRLFLDLSVYREYWQDARVDTLALFGKSGQGQSLRQLVSERLADRYAVEFTEARAIYRESMAIFDRTFRITEVLRILSILVAFIGILSALMAVQLERRKEFAVLRAIGLTRSQVSLLIMLESAILGVLAALVAIPTGMAMAWVLTDVIQLRAFGWTMPFIIQPGPLWFTLLLGLLAALLASLYPAWQASRGHPAPQLRED